MWSIVISSILKNIELERIEKRVEELMITLGKIKYTSTVSYERGVYPSP